MTASEYPPGSGGIRLAVLMPHAPGLIPDPSGGSGGELDVTVAAVRRLARQIVRSRPDVVVVISPQGPRRPGAFGIWHGPRIRGDLSPAEPDVPLTVDMPVDQGFVVAIAERAAASGMGSWFIAAHPLDHGSLVPLWFLAEAGWGGAVVVLAVAGVGLGGDLVIGEAIAGAARALGRRVALVASGDLSRCLTPGSPDGYDPRGALFDAHFLDRLRAGRFADAVMAESFLAQSASEDVVEPVAVAAAATHWRSDGHRVLSYESPLGVGHGVALLYEAPHPPEESEMSGPDATPVPGPLRLLPEIARRSLRAAFAGSDEGPPEGTGRLAERCGVFVTLRDPKGRLRGCAGAVEPGAASLLAEVWFAARSAAFEDRRFPPLSLDELAALTVEVDVAGCPEPLSMATARDRARHGILIRGNSGRQGLELPGEIETGCWEDRICQARRRAGVSADEPFEVQQFRLERAR